MPPINRIESALTLEQAREQAEKHFAACANMASQASNYAELPNCALSIPYYHGCLTGESPGETTVVPLETFTVATNPTIARLPCDPLVALQAAIDEQEALRVALAAKAQDYEALCETVRKMSREIHSREAEAKGQTFKIEALQAELDALRVATRHAPLHRAIRPQTKGTF